MRWSACLWGGRLNPIIPVGEYPACWREEQKPLQRSDRQVAEDYMSFFEPDVLIEAEQGLAASIGYGALSEDKFHAQLLTLDDLHGADEGRRPDFRFGLSIIDVYCDIYESQRQFVLRDPPPSFVFTETSLTPIVEAVFGSFPTEAGAEHFREAYQKVFNPELVDVSPKHWFAYFLERATVPFLPTNHKLDIKPRGNRELTFFVFDHTQPHDLIDYWNRRLFETPIYPVPLCWATELSETVTKMVTDNFRPIPQNPFGTKFIAHIHFGRSISQDVVADFCRTHLAGCPKDSIWPAGTWHPRVPQDGHGPHQERHQVEVESVDIEAELEEDRAVSFRTLSPAFAERYGLGQHRWANILKLHAYGMDDLALVYPSNLKDRRIPRLFLSLLERPIISREGWVILPTYQGSRERLELSDGETAIREWLKRYGIDATISGAGRIAKQMIASLGGLWGVHLIDDEETIKLLNNMAGQEIELGAKDDVTRKQFQGRTAHMSRWTKLVEKRAKASLPRISIEDFPKHGILKSGLSVDCPNCQHGNWYGLDQVDYDVTCERCLKAFRFPQGSAKPQWRYRVTGPFSVPNFAEGSYAVALTLQALSRKLHGASDKKMTFATGLELRHADWTGEVDFALWYGNRATLGQANEPSFVVGEAKSFATDAVKQDDLRMLKQVAEILPGVILIVSVMKRAFSDGEKAMLAELVQWSWDRSGDGPRAHVLLMTGVELFARHHVEQAWKEAGTPYPDKADYHTFADLREFAYATQRIHLALDRFVKLRSAVRASAANATTKPAQREEGGDGAG
jgi:hypothetical protein